MSDTAEATEAEGTNLPGTTPHGGHGDWRIYVAGYGLCIIQTAVAFAVASTSYMTHDSNLAAIACLAIGQMLVQLIFFVHLSTTPDAGANTAALAYAAMVIGLVVVGSMWIMAHLNTNMMPAAEHMARMR